MINRISGLEVTNKVAPQKSKKIEKEVQKQAESQQASVKSCSYQNVKAYQAGFNNALSNAEDRKKYNDVLTSLRNSETKVVLNKLLKEGVLLNNDSNDGSTVLDNLHKMVTEPRMDGLKPAKLVNATIAAIDNPYSISHVIGDIPEETVQDILSNPEHGVRTEEELEVGNGIDHAKNGKFSREALKTATDVAANLEFALAHKHPAEFARIAEGLSSENYLANKNVPLSVIADKKEQALLLLDDYNLFYEAGKRNSVNIAIQPDKNAILRAQIQNSGERDKGERSAVDVLMQSAFMDIAAKGTYNSLNDRVLKDIAAPEIGFTETIITGQPKKEVVFDDIDKATGKVVHNTDAATMTGMVLNTLRMGEDVTCGCVKFNQYSQKYEYNASNKNNVLDTHLLTITNVHSDSQTGKLVFECYDTNDTAHRRQDIPAESLFNGEYHMNFAVFPEKAV